MSDYSTQWREILARHRIGRRLLLAHLVLVPSLVFILGYVISEATGNDPVWFYVLSFGSWVIVLVWLIERYEPYTCPQCGSKVYPSGAVSLLPLPCSKCGLKMPVREP